MGDALKEIAGVSSLNTGSTIVKPIIQGLNGSRVLIMNNGVIEQFGPPLELYDNPANVFVATFLGAPSINLLEGHVVNSNGALAVRLSNGSTIVTSEILGWLLF